MERAKKMVLIPKEQLDRIQRQSETVNSNISLHAQSAQQPTVSTNTALQSAQTTGDNLSRLDNDLKQILESRTYANEQDRLKEYLSVLRKYLFFVEESRRPTPLKNEEAEKNEEDAGKIDYTILESVPKIYKTKAQLLLKHLRTNSDRIKWGDNGVVFIDGLKIKDSNIIDLINDALRLRKKVRAAGRREFARFLQDIQTPREYVGNEDFFNVSTSTPNQHKKILDQQQQQHKNSQDGSLFDIDNTASFEDEETILLNKSLNSSGKRKSNRRTSTPMPSKKWLSQLM